MKTKVTILREAVFPDDYATVAGVISAEHGPEWPVSAADLAANDAARDPRFFRLVMLAEAGGEAVATGSAGHIPYAHRKGRFQIDMRVRPERQGQGFGKALYHALLERLAPLQPEEMVAEVWEALPRPMRFFNERGFTITWRSIDSKVDPLAVDLSAFQGLEERLSANGIEVITYAGLGEDPQRDRKLYELDWALLLDVPSAEERTPVSLEQFVGETIDAPGWLPDACFIARHAGEWVGYSNLRAGENFLMTQMTGVLPDWRGQGLATLLKLKGIQYARAHGGVEVRTTNDAANTAMLAINQRLGFEQVGSMARFVKKINASPALSLPPG